MSKKVLVVAPHPDDETLGCGGTLLKHNASGDSLHWLIATTMSTDVGFTQSQITQRDKEIEQVGQHYQFDSVTQLPFLPAQLDQISTGELVASFSHVIQTVKPNIIYVPYRYDVHSDHKHCFDAAISATKAFRAPFIQSIRAYETVSETDFNLDPMQKFNPNLWVDTAKYLNDKLKIMACYQSELGLFPFPRSVETITALAQLRGSQIGVNSAEAFMILKDIQ